MVCSRLLDRIVWIMWISCVAVKQLIVLNVSRYCASCALHELLCLNAGGRTRRPNVVLVFLRLFLYCSIFVFPMSAHFRCFGFNFYSTSQEIG